MRPTIPSVWWAHGAIELSLLLLPNSGLAWLDIGQCDAKKIFYQGDVYCVINRQQYPFSHHFHPSPLLVVVVDAYQVLR